MSSSYASQVVPSALSTELLAQAGAATVFALVVAAVVASALNWQGTTRWKHSFCSLLLLAAVVVQLYFVVLVAIKLPVDREETVKLSECRSSSKGGKVPGSFRDCERGEGARCTLKRPCSGCDWAIPNTIFDNFEWDMGCSICSLRNAGTCAPVNVAGSEVQWCVGATGKVEPCRQCCLRVLVNGEQVDNTDFYTANHCANVFDKSTFPWDTTLLQCADPKLPLATRWGCCAASMRPPQYYKRLGDGRTLPSCAFTGPRGTGWHFCKDQFFTVQSNGTDVRVPTGCAYWANGETIPGVFHCAAPTLVSAGSTSLAQVDVGGGGGLM
jgi:hypothetical protein